METRVPKSSFSGINGAKKERKMLEKSSQSFLGPGCREFESRHSDQKSRIRFCGVWTFLFVWSETRTNKCDCPVDSRLPTARRRQHLYFLPSGKKMQTSLATLDYQRAINKDMIAESLFFTSFCGHYFGHRFKCTTKILFSNQT